MHILFSNPLEGIQLDWAWRRRHCM